MAVSDGKAVKERPAMAGDRLSSQELLRAYRTMVLSRKLDDKEIQLKNQSLIFFQISGAGHEAVLIAAGMTLRPGYDWFYPYYRDRALCLVLGMTPLEMLLAGVAAKDDPASGGRQMPSHWGHKRLNIVSQSSPTGTQCLQAIGAAEAGRMFEKIPGIDGREDHFHARRGRVSVGRRRGDERRGILGVAQLRVHAQAACGHSRRGQRVRDFGAGRSADPGRRHLEDRLVHFPISSCRASMAPISSPATARCPTAVEYARARKGPALVHAKVIRPYSHSLSDDEKLYKTAEERAAEATRDPIARFGFYLTSEGIATEGQLQQILSRGRGAR